MTMKKRIFACVLALAMLALCLTSCADSEDVECGIDYSVFSLGEDDRIGFYVTDEAKYEWEYELISGQLDVVYTSSEEKSFGLFGIKGTYCYYTVIFDPVSVGGVEIEFHRKNGLGSPVTFELEITEDKDGNLRIKAEEKK